MRGLARFEDGLRGEERMEGFEERGAALRGVRVHHHPQGEVTCDLVR